MLICCSRNIYYYYSFSRLLTHYKWFIWLNFPKHSYSSQKKDTFLKTLTRFTCLHTRSNLLSVFCKTLQKNVIILHRFNHVLVQKTQTQLIQASKTYHKKHIYPCVNISSKTDDTGQNLRMIWTGAQVIVFWKMNPGRGRQRGIGGENKMRGWGQRSGLTMREVGLQAHLQGFNTTDTYDIITVHSSSTSDETTFIILCTVTTYTLKLITVELICSQVVLTCALFVQNWETAV